MTRKRRVIAGDRLVEIDKERIAAVLRDLAGTSQRALADALRARGVAVTQQQLNLLANGGQKKCRASLLRELARLVGVPELWLRGRDHMAYLPRHDLRGEFDESHSPFAPARSDLAAYRFSRACEHALLERERRRLGSAAAGEMVFLGDELQAVRKFLVDLISPASWRMKLLPLHASINVAGLPRHRAREEQATVELARAMTWVLDAWLSGREEDLDLETIARLREAEGKKFEEVLTRAGVST